MLKTLSICVALVMVLSIFQDRKMALAFPESQAYIDAAVNAEKLCKKLRNVNQITKTNTSSEEVSGWEIAVACQRSVSDFVLEVAIDDDFGQRVVYDVNLDGYLDLAITFKCKEQDPILECEQIISEPGAIDQWLAPYLFQAAIEYLDSLVE